MKKLSILVIHRMTSYRQMSAGGFQETLDILRAQNDPLVQRMIVAEETHNRSMDKIRDALEKRNVAAIWRHDFSGLFPDSFDLVVTVGGDGTVLHASHSVGKTPILSINSSPETSTGYFSSGDADNFPEIMDRILDGNINVQKLHRMEVMVNGEVVNGRVLNDVLFCNDCPAMTTRYQVSLRNRQEPQISSGVWISTAAGSTAAVKAAGGVPMDPTMDTLQYVVREPCPAGGNDQPRLPMLVSGLFGNEDGFAIRSKSLAATLFIDGPHVAVPVKYGDIITFSGGVSPLFLYEKLDKNKT